MNTSIVLTDTHTIGVDSYGKFMVQDIKVSIKEVPFVRYRFLEYNEKDMEYIKMMKKKFNYSSHMAEININEDTADIIKRLESIDNLIKFVYVAVDDNEVDEGFSEEKLELVEKLEDSFYDRLMLKDESNSLHAVAATRLKKQLSDIVTDIELADIGVCSSPLSFDGKNACLTAVKARELSAEYAENDEVALPSANHECMSCCGCIRYHVFTGNVAAPISKSGNSSGEPKTKSKSTTPSKPKGIIKWK